MIFKCKNCGGNIVYDPERGTMCCPHCESLDSEDKVLSTEYMTTCGNCGAPMEGAISTFTSATKCPNCGTYAVLDERVEGEYLPELILPFKVSKQEAIAFLKDEFKNRIFTPLTFLSKASLNKIEGTYVPFFMYDYDTDTDYYGTGTKVRSWSSGGYRYTETSYYDIRRKMETDFDMVPVDASDYMEDDYMDLLEPYNYKELRGFEDKLMSGFYGEIYNKPEGELEDRAKVKIKGAVETLINQSISGYSSVKQNSMNVGMSKKKAHYALLPVWEYVYSYHGKDYKFHVNGQTGKVVGRTPVATGQVVAYGATVFTMVSIIGLMIRLALAFV